MYYIDFIIRMGLNVALTDQIKSSQKNHGKYEKQEEEASKGK